MSLVKGYQSGWQVLKDHVVAIWLNCIICFIFGWILLLPWAGYLDSHLKLKKNKRKPEIVQDLLSQFDKIGPLAILFVLAIVIYVLFIIVNIACGAVLGKISPALLTLGRFILFLGFFPLFTITITYTILQIVDKNTGAIDALKKAFGLVTSEIFETYKMGIGLFILCIPCGLGFPVGIDPVIGRYMEKLG